jgi:Protein of unknown function (DUF3892)
VATHTIGAVRLVTVSRYRRHDHVDSVKLSTDEVFPRAEVVARIRSGSDAFVTYHHPPAQVYVDDCPHCRASECLTTHPGSVTANNLLHMLTF